MPKSWQRCVTSLSVSSNVPSSSKNSTRSRADILPSLCCRSRRCAPPPSWAIWSRFFSSAIFSSSFIGSHYRRVEPLFVVRCSLIGLQLGGSEERTTNSEQRFLRSRDCSVQQIQKLYLLFR